MKLYQASLFLNVLKAYQKLFPNESLNVLISLAFNESERKKFIIDYRHMIASLIIDSGAWSVAQGNSNLTLNKVIADLLAFGHRCDRYFNFDVDFSNNGFATNINNQFKMEAAGLRPVPVIHNFYNYEISYYINTGKYDWLALGSSQSTQFNAIKYAVDRIKIWGNPNIKIHWFGGSSYDWLCRLPIASCDTTSWAATGTYGNIMYWNPRNPAFYKGERIYIGGRIKKLRESEPHFQTYQWQKELKKYLYETFGFTYADLCGYDDKLNMQIVNARFYAELERRINDERIKHGIALE